MSYLRAICPIIGVKIRAAIAPIMKIGRKRRYFSKVSPTVEKSKWFNIFTKRLVVVEKSIYIDTRLIKAIVKKITRMSVLTSKSFTKFFSLL